MARELTDRDSLKRALFRLLNTDGTDDALTEHDPDDLALEAIYQALQHGVWDAQRWMIHVGWRDRWIASFDISAWSTDGDFRYVSLPSNFLMLPSDEEQSALWNGTYEWGEFIRPDMRRRVTGNYYWLQNERIYLAKGATIPATLAFNYHYEHPGLEDDTTVDFPTEHRPLIVFYAAVRCLPEDWCTLTPERKREVEAGLTRLQDLSRQLPRSLMHRRTRAKQGYGSHWF